MWECGNHSDTAETLTEEEGDSSSSESDGAQDNNEHPNINDEYQKNEDVHVVTSASDSSGTPAEVSNLGSHCFKCLRLFNKASKPIKCEICNERCNRQINCSGLKKGKDLSWNCGMHVSTQNATVADDTDSNVADESLSNNEDPNDSGDPVEEMTRKAETESYKNTTKDDASISAEVITPGTHCQKCTKKFNKSSMPIKCELCNERCHRQTRCSGIKNGKARPWNCGAHDKSSCEGVTDPSDFVSPEKDLVEETTSGTHCHRCERLFNKISKPVKCQQCNERCHRQIDCSGIKQGVKDFIWK